MKIEFKSLPYYPLRVTSPFGIREVNGIKGATPWHDGVDLGRDKRKYSVAPAGEVLAVMDGIVVDKGYNDARGYYIKIRHQDIAGHKIETLYQHLFDRGIGLNTNVKAGQVIGKMGQSGVGNGIHLHFELRVNGKCIDPLPFLKHIDRQERNRASEITQYKYYDEFKKKYHFDNNTMTFFCKHPAPDELFRKCLNGEELHPQSITFIKKYKYGNVVLERIKQINEENK